MPQQELEIFEEAILDRLDYDADTGVFTWKMPTRERFATENAFTSWRTRFGGKAAGKVRTDGYISIRLTTDAGTKSFLAHRMAWFVVYGTWPRQHIDHMNGDRSDNRITNLRDVSRDLNQRNMKVGTDSRTGVLGVTWSKHAKRWLARATIEGRMKNLGYYLNFDDAVAAREKAVEGRHGYHENHGKRGKPAAQKVQAYIKEKEATRIKHAP